MARRRGHAVHGGAAAQRPACAAALAALAAISRWLGAAERGADLAGRDLARTWPRGGRPVLARPDLHGDLAAPAQALDRAAVDVRDEVAEAIDAQHFAVAPSPLARRPGRESSRRRPVASSGRPSAFEVDARRQPRRRRREPVAPLERAADRSARVPALRSARPPARGGTLLEHRGQDAVVRRDEPVVARLAPRSAARDEPTPGSTTTRKIVPGGNVPVAGGQLERRRQHVVRRDVVRDVDERRRPGRCRA